MKPAQKKHQGSSSPSPSRPRRKPKNVIEAINNGYYRPLIRANLEKSYTIRAAILLDQMAEDFPKAIVGPHYLLKAVKGAKKTPSKKSPEVELFCGRYGSIRMVLMRMPIGPGGRGRDLVPVPGIGVRATTDSRDVLQSRLYSWGVRITNTHKAASRCAELIDEKELSKDEREWYRQHIRTVSRLLGPSIANKLLPPPSKDEDGKK